MRTPDRLAAGVFVLATMFLLSACGGGSGGGTSGENASNALLVMDINVADFDGVALNQILEITFSEELDPDSVRPETIQIREGPDYGKQVPGDFRVDGDRVYFYPRLPTMDTLEDSGFHPGTSYRVTVFGVPSVSVVRNYTQDRMLASEHVDFFQTALADDPDLFIDNFLDPGPPRVLSVNPVNDAIEVESNAVITLTFNRRPLKPGTVNSDNFKLVMLERDSKIWNRPIPGGPVLNQALERVTVVFSPTFPLADKAIYELTVSNRVEDLVGASVPAFSSRFTIKDEPYQYTKIRLDFTEQEKIDSMDESETTASWNGLVPDHLAALFTEAGGSGKSGDLITNADMTFTPFNTDGVEQEYEDGIWYDIFNFRKFEIADGATVRFEPSTQTNSLKIKSLFPMKIDGILTVSGGKGDQAASYGSYYYGGSGALGNQKYKYGGDGGPAGGDGADGYRGTFKRPMPTNDGKDAAYGGYGGKGGKAGTYGSSYYYSYGGGGGGGGSRLDGAPGQRNRVSSYWGKGGLGGLGRSGNLEREPNVGGAGGGCGGCGYYKYYSYSYFYMYQTGAGGGGGGGAVWLQCASTIQVGADGQVLAEGGLGGDTAAGTYSYMAGAGGGGGGGSIKAVSTSGIDLVAGAKLSVAGGEGGKYVMTYTPYKGAEGGKGGTGFLRFEVPEVSLVTGMTGADLTYTPVSMGTFAPQGGGVPSIGQTTWLNLGVFDPELIEHKPLTDRSAELENDGMELWVQMADEHPQKPGEPYLIDMDVQNDSTYDTDTLSEWTQISTLETLTGNGYQFIRVRVIFQLDANHRFDDRLPRLDWLDIHFRY